MRRSLLLLASMALAGCIWTVEGGGQAPVGSPSPAPSGIPSGISSLPGSPTPTGSPTPGTGAFRVELSWPAQYQEVDMDLHLVDASAGGALWSPTFDCDFMTCKAAFVTTGLDWGVAGDASDNPSLLQDNISETVPEITEIASPADGSYEIYAHYYSTHVGSEIPVSCHIRVFATGVDILEGDMTLTAVNKVWDVATVTWASGTASVTPVNTIFTTTGP